MQSQARSPNNKVALTVNDDRPETSSSSGANQPSVGSSLLMLPNAPIRACSREDLINLLAFFEGELQARDLALSVLRSELKGTANAKRDEVLLKSLQSDLTNLNVVDSEQLTQLYPGHSQYLQRLVEMQKESQKRFAEKLLETEDRHARELFALKDKLEKVEQSVGKTKHGLCSVLEERITSLKNECTRKQEELDRLDEQLKSRDKDMEEERERQKTIVLFMLNERKQLLSLMHQLRMKTREETSDDSSSSIVAELKKQLRNVCEERNSFNRQCNTLQADKTRLLSVIHNLEEDIVSLKANTFINRPTEIGGYVVANKAAVATELPADASNTGTVRYNKWHSSRESMGGISERPRTTASFPTRPSEISANFQNANSINGNVVTQRSYPAGDDSNRPNSTNTPRQHPAMGVRGSQLVRNSRPTMGISSSARDADYQAQSFPHPHSLPTTNSSEIPTRSRANQRIIPINHASSPTTSNMVVYPSSSDARITKRSSSLPRSNGDLVMGQQQPKITSPTQVSKIRSPTQHHPPVAAPPGFQPQQRIPPGYEQSQQQRASGHTHIS